MIHQHQMLGPPIGKEMLDSHDQEPKGVPLLL
jgi:hypothetical protein